MKFTNQALLSVTFLLCSFFLFFSCKKLNDATTLGGGLIPAVDNVTTFAADLEVEVYNDTFGLAAPHADSLRIRGGVTHYLGNITNDPLFGTSTGTLFTQLKPATFRFSYGYSSPDSLVALDSVILVLKYVNTFGDSITPQSVNVFEIDQSADFRYDTSYLIRQNQITYSNLLGSSTFIPQTLKDSMHTFEDSSSHELRIRLNDAFGQRLLAYDSTSTPGNNAYYSDSVFNSLLKGFAIVPGGMGNALIGIEPSESKLTVYYKYKHGVLDTAKKDFVFTTGSASANFIQHDYSGSQLATSLGATAPQDYAYIQTQPGTFSRIKILGLDTLKNRIIHRAELSMTQAYNDPLDNIFTPPAFLYIDAIDVAKNVSRAIPFDITTPDPTTGSLVVTNTAFGFQGIPVTDGANTVKEWKFNISRYVQNVIKGTEPAYELRLYAPYVTTNTFGLAGTDYLYSSYVNPGIAVGQVRLYGGTQISNPHRMRLKIIYSKI